MCVERACGGVRRVPYRLPFDGRKLKRPLTDGAEDVIYRRAFVRGAGFTVKLPSILTTYSRATSPRPKFLYLMEELGLSPRVVLVRVGVTDDCSHQCDDKVRGRRLNEVCSNLLFLLLPTTTRCQSTDLLLHLREEEEERSSMS
ncbi:hypothetical protein EVAR_37583_1 [Eumeta japonica]|uniref:Uncharacterized protein n=1 Tax=Eumeta variegata TaxID=151549 RepID=A0A4C1VP49_EUMVA|nr:hypothetical protein EVAR_37583_1 [Eumeta japonica]